MNTKNESWVMVMIATILVIFDCGYNTDWSLLWRIPTDFIVPFGFVFLARIYQRFL
jgi:hypothetical protein